MNQKSLTNHEQITNKHITYECKCRFDGRKYNSSQWWNINKYQCEYSKHHICEKDYFLNPCTCTCENRKYLASIIDNSAIICDEIIDVEEINFNKKI